jgi:hypothetical protein
MELNPYNSAEALGTPTLSEREIEMCVERRMSKLRYFLHIARTMTPAAYDEKVRDLDEWAAKMYEKLA